MNKSLTFLLHSRIADENGPHIGAGLGDHQHTDHGDGIGPKNNGNVETEAQHDGKVFSIQLFSFKKLLFRSDGLDLRCFNTK